MSIGLVDAYSIARLPEAALVIALLVITGLAVAARALWKRLREKDEEIARLQEMVARMAERLLDHAMRRNE